MGNDEEARWLLGEAEWDHYWGRDKRAKMALYAVIRRVVREPNVQGKKPQNTSVETKGA